MLKSMTGFGRGEYMDGKHSFTVELKAVNHRYNDVVVRMPRCLNVLEDKLRRTILTKLSRGRIDVFITMEDYSPEGCQINFDRQLALAYKKSLQQAADALLYTMSETQEFMYIIKAPDVISQKEKQTNVDELWVKLESALNIAIENLLVMRKSEGNNIYQDLVARVNLLRDYLDKIQNRAPMIPIEAQKRLHERINELLKEHGQILDTERLMQEIAIFADKTNITEEIVRLKSHIEQFIKTIQSKQPVGRKLDFLVQEFNREVNTIASKANDFTITNVAVDMKSEIEKIREQIQNIE